MNTHDFELVSVEEFARRMEVSRSTVFAWLAKGYLAEGKLVIRVGKTIRFIWSLDAVTALATQTASRRYSDEERNTTTGGKLAAVNLEY